MEILIEKEFKYLGEVPEFKKNGLPSGYLIDKGKVGCGGTSLALEDERDTIICVPFVSLVKNKMFSYGDKVIGVYEGVTEEDIRNYINTHKGVKKIICTYDSLPKVAKVTGYDYFLLVDELHLLFIQYVFRKRAVKGVLNLYRNFKEWSFLTATPIEDDLMLEELKDIPTYKINWENKTSVTVNALKCGQPLATTGKIIKEFLEGKRFGNCHIFLNSVESIVTLIKNYGLTGDNTRIIFSKNNEEGNEALEKYKNTCKGITNGETTDPVKKINIYTSTCFEGCDLFDVDGKIFIVSEGHKAHTLYDISTQVRQIAGRIRNTQYKDITHIYKATRYNEDLSLEEYTKVVLEEEVNAKEYVSMVNSSDKLIKGTKESTYAYVRKEEDGTLSFDPNLMKLDIYNYKCLHHTYSLDVNLSEEYLKVGINVISEIDRTSDKLLKDSKTRTTFKDAIIEWNEIMKKKECLFYFPSEDDEKRLNLLKKKYPYIDDAYKKLGMQQLEEMKYQTSNIQRLLISINDKFDNKAKVAKFLKTAKGFEEGAFVTGASIKSVLGAIYDELGIKNKPTIDNFREFAVIEEKQKRVDGKKVRGYIIKYIKIKGV